MAESGARLVLLAAGGTGGHLFPAEALAAALMHRGVAVDLATDARGGRYGGKIPARQVHVIPSETVRGRNPISLARTAAVLGYGMLRAHILLGRLNPAVVVGFGGYPTVPPVLAAILRRIPTLIHEQNAVMGRANRLLAPRVSAIATSFAGVLDADVKLAAKATRTGNPLRPAVLAAAAEPFVAPEQDGLLRLLVFGGSQGAKIMADIVPAAIEKLDPSLRARLLLAQQAREEDLRRVRQDYERLKIAADVAPFFSDLPARIAAAHLVVSRSGAGTVAELAGIGRPSILVPLPHALDQDQFANAGVLQQADGALRLRQDEFTPERLAAEITALASAPQKLVAIAAAARSQGVLDAADRLADLVMRVGRLSDAPLTPFQSETDTLLLRLLAKYSSDDIRRTVIQRPQESFIQIEVLPHQLKAYIYPDGAEISGKSLDKRFEIYDYASLSELQCDFLDVANATF